MHKIFLIIVAFLSNSLLFGGECKHDSNNFRCVKYVKNYDADTITFNIPSTHPLLGKKINIRVYGVDTPELRTKNRCEKIKALEAKSIVTNLLIKANRIDLENVQRGKYFRIVADVKFDGNSLKNYLLKQGLAYKYYGKTKVKIDWCQSKRSIASMNNEK